MQGKSAYHESKDGGYGIRALGAAGGRVWPGEVDVLVAYVAPENAWYVIPVGSIAGSDRSEAVSGGETKKIEI